MADELSKTYWGCHPVVKNALFVHAFLRALFLLLKRFARSEAFSGRDSSKIVAEKYGFAITWKAAGDQISSFLAAVLILAPVIALHFVSNPNARLGVIVGFTISFVLLTLFTTEAKRSEVFCGYCSICCSPGCLRWRRIRSKQEGLVNQAPSILMKGPFASEPKGR